MSKAREYAHHCNEVYATSPSGPVQSSSMKPNPGPPPTARIAIVTCMDARISPFEMFNLSLGEAHVIRVGGGRAPDALRSLIASEHVLGTNEIMIVHHTDCGFSKAPNEDAARLEVRESLGGTSVDWMSFMLLKSDMKDSVRDDVRFLKESPYIKKGAVISGWIYDTVKGTVEEVVMEEPGGSTEGQGNEKGWVSEVSRAVHQVI